MVDLDRLGTNLKSLREKMGLGQKQIASYLEVDQSLISKFENGERAINTEMLEKLSALYCSPIEQMLSDVYPEVSISFRSDTITHDDLEVIAIINRIALNQLQMDKLIKEQLNA